MKRLLGGIVGFTILETMIFLAVSAALFIAAMILINGQQSRTQFATVVRDFDSRIRSVEDNVATGYYNNTGQTTCTVSGGTITSVTSGGTNQGQNSDCTFIGQVIVPTMGSSTVTIYSTAGLRRNSNVPPQEVGSMSEAKPYLITATTEAFDLDAGVKVISMKTNAGTSFNSLGIFTTFGQYSNGLLASGSNRSDIYAIGPNGPGGIASTLTAPITPLPVGYELNPNNGVEICLSDSNQYAKIILNNGSTNVTIGYSGLCS